MAHDPLVLADVGEEAWSAFHMGGRDERASVATRLRSVVARRARATASALDEHVRIWSRAASLGASIEGPRDEDHLVRGQELAVRAASLEPLWAAAPGVVERAASSPVLRDYVLLFADLDGCVARTIGGGAFEDEARRLRLIAGARWSESARGTNAIGTALAEGRPIAVEGHAHFGRRYRDLVCYAAPVRDPSGKVVAVLDATSTRAAAPRGASAREVLETISGTVHAIEDMLRLRAYASAGHAVTRLLSRAFDRMPSPVLLVEPPGRIARCNEAARVELELAADGRAIDGQLGVDWDALVFEALAPSVGGIALTHQNGRRFRLRAEPIESNDGAVLGVVAFLERSAGAERSASIDTSRKSEPPRPSERPTAGAFSAIFADDPTMDAAVELATRVAPSDLPVMLLAETGAGKELFAAAIHAASRRAQGPFVAVNCGSIAPSLLESELFGHAPGAFTGASPRGRAGLLQSATGGTLFLDEIGEMPLSMQTSLLRVLESGTYHRVGETKESRADVRILCATCRDVPAMVQAGTFRNDLYFRLKGVIVRLPALRERRDRVALARHLLTRAGDSRPFSAELSRFLETHPWPGNVRELRTLLDVVRVLAADDAVLDVSHLPPDVVLTSELARTELALGTGDELADVEASVVSRALEDRGWNVSAAARQLGIARSTVYRMMEKYGLRRTH